MRRNKKGVLDNLGTLISALGVLAITIAVIFLIIAETKTQVASQNPCENTTNFWNSTDNTCRASATVGTLYGHSHTYNATIGVQAAASDIPGWLPIVVITMIGGILLGLVQTFRKR